MIAKEAKAIARRWVMEEAAETPGFLGAFFHGSINWLADEAVFPATSDLDLMIVFAEPPPVKLGKFIYQGVMLEVSYLPLDQLQSPEVILGQSHLAGSFKGSSIILDPSGQLSQLQTVVSQDYAKRQWVRKRCEHARDRILQYLQGVNASAPFHDQVMPWLFATGITTHVLLVAGLKNPTVRRRYMATHDLLAAYGHLDFYETLLEMLGCAHMSRTQVEHHLAALTAVFDVAKTVIKTPFFFASDLSDLARPIAIDGSRELIERGYHRETIFWIVVTYSRCQMVLYHDASREMRDHFTPGYRRLLAELGITSFADFQQRGEQLKRLLPRLWEMTEAIMAANPDIED